MEILNLLSSGGVGGIEKLCEDIGESISYPNCFCFLFDEGTIYEEMTRKEIDVHSLKNIGKSKLSIRKLLKLIKIAKEKDIIVVHHNALIIHLYYCLLHFFLNGKKFVMVAHSCFDEDLYYNYNTKLKNYFRKKILKRTVDISDKIIFVSNAGKASYTCQFDIPEKRTVVIYNGIKNALYSEKRYPVLWEKGMPFRLTYIGRIVEYKGIQLLLDVIAMLKRRKIDVVLNIVGEGDFEPELRKKVEELQINDIVNFCGVQRELDQFLNVTDVFVYPSIIQEVFGISIIEAMAFGVPCVAFTVGGIPEIIEDGKNGYLAEDIDALCLMNKILKLFDKYEKGDIMQIRNTCIRTALRFDVKKTTNGFENCYKSLYD